MEVSIDSIAERLKEHDIPYLIRSMDWFRDDGCDIGEALSGITVESEELFWSAAESLGCDIDNARAVLRLWNDMHLPHLQGYPIHVTYVCKFMEDDSDDDATDSGSVSLFQPLSSY